MKEVMTLSEFKKAIEDWGKSWGIETEVVVRESWTCVYAKRRVEDLGILAEISRKRDCLVSYAQPGAIDLEDIAIKTLFEILKKYAHVWAANLRKREKKKYYLIHKWLAPKFTLDEIEEVKKKFDTDLKDFELIEVENA